MNNNARYAYEGLDRVIHEKARLGILTSLIGNPEGLLFRDLKTLCGLTDGNLNRHLKALDDAGLVLLTKEETSPRPVTRCTISQTGRQKFLEYLNVLETVVKDAAEAEKTASRKPARTSKATKPRSV